MRFNHLVVANGLRHVGQLEALIDGWGRWKSGCGFWILDQWVAITGLALSPIGENRSGFLAIDDQ